LLGVCSVPSLADRPQLGDRTHTGPGGAAPRV